MASFNLFLLPGDGIGPEVMKEAENIIAWFDAQGIARFETERGLVGGSAFDAHGKAISEEDMGLAMASHTASPSTGSESVPSATSTNGTKCAGMK